VLVGRDFTPYQGRCDRFTPRQAVQIVVAATCGDLVGIWELFTFLVANPTR